MEAVGFMWVIRFILLGIILAIDGLGILLLRYRNRFERLAESTLFNCLLLIAYYPLVLLLFLLPPESGWASRPAWLQHISVRIGFPAFSLALFIAGSFLGLATIRQRKVIGAQDTAEGLLTTGMYTYFRHPIWTGMLWIMLALPLLTRNPDGLLVFPFYFLLLWAETILEEKIDMRRRFPEEYERYGETTNMFGPWWVWGLIALFLALIAGVGKVMS